MGDGEFYGYYNFFNIKFEPAILIELFLNYFYYFIYNVFFNVFKS